MISESNHVFLRKDLGVCLCPCIYIYIYIYKVAANIHHGPAQLS